MEVLCFEDWGLVFPAAPFYFRMAFFYLSELYFSTVFPGSGVKPFIFRQFGQ
jgi:hypothetical protein